MKKRRGIIERLIMGKPKEKDFTEADLPANRFKQFGFVFRTRFGIIFRANMLTALFCLPFIIWDLLAGGYVNNYVINLSTSQYLSELLYLSLLQYGIEIPLLIIGFVGLAGLYYVIRRICWGQSIKLIYDFFRGIKESWLQFFLLGLITGVVNLLVQYLFNFALLTMAGGSALVWGLALTALLIFVIIYCVVLMFALCQSSLYKLSFGRLLFNSTILTFKRMFRSVLICFCSLAPILVFQLMPWIFVKIAGYCLVVLFSLGFAATVQTVFCHWVFDIFINAKFYPDYVGIGLIGGKIPEELYMDTSDEMAEEEVINEDNG